MRDEVPEAARNGRKGGTDDAQRSVAGDQFFGLQDNGEVDAILAVGYLQGPFLRLIVVAQSLGAGSEKDRAGGMGEDVLEGLHDLLVICRVAKGLDVVQDLLTLPGIEIRERQVVEFALEGVDVELGGDGSIDIDGFPGNAVPIWFGEMMEGAQVVQPVGELDQENTQAPAGAEEDLAVGQILDRCPVQMTALKLGTAVDQFGYHLAE